MRFLFLIFVCLQLSLPTDAKLKTNLFRVIIDPGHGGIDSGATRNGIREADIALSVSKRLAKLLKRNPLFSVSLTRRTNRKVGLKDRALFANRKKGDLFLSIHANASLNRRARGVEFYMQNHLEADEEALFLAAREEDADNSKEVHQQIVSMGNFDTDSTEVLTILDDLVRSQRIVKSDKLASSLSLTWKQIGRTKKHAVRQAPFYLTTHVLMPSVLVELGYLSNRTEAKRLTSPSYQKKMARSLYRGIIRFKETMDKTR